MHRHQQDLLAGEQVVCCHAGRETPAYLLARCNVNGCMDCEPSGHTSAIQLRTRRPRETITTCSTTIMHCKQNSQQIRPREPSNFLSHTPILHFPPPQSHHTSAYEAEADCDGSQGKEQTGQDAGHGSTVSRMDLNYKRASNQVHGTI